MTDASGRALVFSAIINNNPGSVNGVLDQIGVTLANATPDGLSSNAMTKKAPAPVQPPRGDVECAWIGVNLC